MSILKELKTNDLLGDLNKIIGSHLVDGDDNTTAMALLEIIDENGMKSSKTMKTVIDFQKNNKFTPGLYQKLRVLQIKLSMPEEQTETSHTDEGASEMNITPIEEEKDEPVAEEKLALPGNREIKMEEWRKKEEEKMAKRLDQREKKLRERMVLKEERKLKKMGMLLEHAEKIRELKNRMASNRIQIKALQQQNRECREQVTELKSKRIKKDASSPE